MEGSLSVFFKKQGTHIPAMELPRAAARGATRTAAEAVFVVGSSPNCSLCLEGAELEPEHFSFTWDSAQSTWVLQNLAAAPLEIERMRLVNGRSLPLLVWETNFMVKDVSFRFQRRPDTPVYGNQPAMEIPLTDAGLMIGRGPENADKSNTPRLALDASMRAVSRNQAMVRKTGSEYVLVNLNSSTVGRTILNGDQNFDERKLVLGDCIQIPNCEYYTFKFTGDKLRHLGQGGALQGIDLSVDVKQGRILHTVNIELRKGGFMGIIGGSGQGKSTLMNSVCGIVPATGGGVYVDGFRLRSPLDVAKAGIAFVPQDDIVHKELTVEDALYFAAKLRLNASATQIRDLVDTTMETLRLKDHRYKQIVNLSGGQRKRVSIASELLVAPDYIFLDEPTSGLDPQTEKSLMGELSLLARHKRIGVACTTHVLQNCHVLTQIAFISRGRLIFNGNPEDGARFFILAGSPEGAARIREERARLAAGIGSPESGSNDQGEAAWESDLLDKIARIYDIAQDTTKEVELQNRESDAWQAEFQASEHYRPPAQDPSAVKMAPPNVMAKVSPVRCLWLLVLRQWKILASSKLNYLFLLAQALVIGILIAWVSDNLVLQMFLGLIATLWFGCSNGAQQIVAELAIFRRERLAGLGIHTYLISKFLFYGVITGLQGMILYAMILFGSPALHPDTTVDIEDAKADLSGHVPDKATREFRQAFFDKPWNALAAGDDSHDYGDPSAPGASKSAADDFDVVSAPGTAPEPKTIYVNPTGLHVVDADFALLEKISWFFRLRTNVLDSLSVKKYTVKPNADADIALLRAGNGIVSWKIFVIDILALRFGTILLGALVGVALGLAVSALVNTPTQSVMWVPLILIPQILFGSFVVIIPEMNDSVLMFSRALPSFNLQQVMDVGLILGRATPRMSNETKIPAFVDPPDKQEVVKWDGQQTLYDRISEVNKSWQNLIVSRLKLGARPKELFEGSSHYKDSVEHRDDAYLKKDDIYHDLGPALFSASVLGVWAVSCYGIAVLALYRRQTGK